MITTKHELKECLRKDRIVNDIPIHLSLVWKLKNFFFPNYIWEYVHTFRMCEYYYNNLINKKLSVSVGYLYYKIKLRRLGVKLGFSISINCFDGGLSIPHYGTIVVNSRARIGKNCRLHVGSNIGASAGNSEAPQIGDNVYIGPGAILFGNIKIADNVTIGANATVNKSCEQNNVVLAGSPARIVKENYPVWWKNNGLKLN